MNDRKNLSQHLKLNTYVQANMCFDKYFSNSIQFSYSMKTLLRGENNYWEMTIIALNLKANKWIFEDLKCYYTNY